MYLKMKLNFATRNGERVALLVECEYTKGEAATRYSPAEGDDLEITKVTLAEEDADLIPLIQGDTLEDIRRAVALRAYSEAQYDMAQERSDR